MVRKSHGVARVSSRGPRNPSISQTGVPGLVSVPFVWIWVRAASGIEAIMILGCSVWLVYSFNSTQGILLVASV